MLTYYLLSPPLELEGALYIIRYATDESMDYISLRLIRWLLQYVKAKDNTLKTDESTLTSILECQFSMLESYYRNVKSMDETSSRPLLPYIGYTILESFLQLSTNLNAHIPNFSDEILMHRPRLSLESLNNLVPTPMGNRAVIEQSTALPTNTRTGSFDAILHANFGRERLPYRPCDKPCC